MNFGVFDHFDGGFIVGCFFHNSIEYSRNFATLKEISDTLYLFMASNSTPKATSLWLDTIPDARRFGTQTNDLQTEVVIIGGGIVGTMVAWRLAERGVKSIILERNTLATGDTGFTTAFITRVPDTSAADLKERYGQDFVNRTVAATTEAQEWFKDVIRKEGIACDFAEVPSYNCAYAEDDEDIADEFEALGPADKKAKVVRGAEAGAHFSAVKEAIRFDGEARYHVRKFLIGLLQRPLAKQFITMCEDTEVTDVEVGKQVRVTTSKGVVTADKVVVTTGKPFAPFAELQSLLTTRLTFVIGAKFEGEIPFGDAMFWDTDEPYQYYRRFDDHTIILGGGDRDAEDVPKANAPKPHDLLKKFIETRMGRKDFTVTHTWSGSMFETEDGLPFLSAHPHYGGKVFVGTGFGGNGMVCGALAGMVIGDLASGNANAYADVFSFARIGKPIPAPAPRPRKPLLENMMVRRVLQVLLPLVYVAVLAFPAHAFFGLRGGTKVLSGLEGSAFAATIFPLLGLYAFTLIWAQIMIGTLMPALRKLFKRIELFHRCEGAFALLFGLLHPVMLVAAVGLNTYLTFQWTDRAHLPYILLGEMQIFLLFLTAGTALMMKLPWLKERWHVIHYCNYALFIFAWIHSWNLGSDVVGGGARVQGLWLFFGVTGVLGIIARLLRKAPAGSSGALTGARVVVAKEADLPMGKPYRVKAGGLTIALVKLQDGIFAINNVCGHAGGPLDEGPFAQYVIECPWHGSKFDVRTGAVVNGPATKPQRTYKVNVVNGNVEVEI